VRCAVYYGGPKEIITLSRQHNDANILSIGARFVFVDDIVEIINLWLDTDFSQEERHKRRIDKIDM
jgi:ribose 5-phosphate isomerase B